ncbi:MAG: hypothetical protein JW724_00240 [Candidatus Altiarchaeota archaeon]|nr:hypothetical protein [Candidatus Altiarchaeota archaeon]
MKCSARLTTDSADPESVSRALEVDNIKLEGLKIKTTHGGGRISTEIHADNLGTLINTLDDIVSCQMVAEKSISDKK